MEDESTPAAPPVPPVSGPGFGPTGAEFLPAAMPWTPPPRRNSRWLAAGVVVVVVALLAGVVAIGGFSRSEGPDHWDARLGDLPARVESLRGLRFTHPVPVRFLDDKAFRRVTAVDANGKPNAKKKADRITASLRAAGLLSGEVDLVKAISKERQSSVLAFYSPSAKEIVVRGTGPLDAAHRVTVAHELTHVLQDQHFDLPALQARVARDPEGSSDALRAVVEGDAVRIEKKYAKTLSAADRASYRTANDKGVDQAGRETSDVPAILTLQFSAPYRYGPPVLTVLAADGGNRNVDRAFTHGVFTQELFIEPSAPLTESKPRSVAAPRLAHGEKARGKSETFGAYDLYLLLASRIDPAAALDAAFNWNGGRIQEFRADGRTCISGVVVPERPSRAGAMATDFVRWAGALPPGMATVGRRGNAVTFRSCDPGARSKLTSPDAAIVRSGVLLDIHSEIEGGLVAEFVKAGRPASAASCFASEIARSPQIGLLIQIPERDITSEMARTAVGDAGTNARNVCLSAAQ
ncbi:MAG: hypothetical protein ABJC79_14165 [Acidimicrobiia bacterium]